MHENYRRAIDKAQRSHAQNRNPIEIDEQDIALARLYCYALRIHVIGAFHATKVALEECPTPNRLTQVFRQRAVESLSDLAGQSMERIPDDYLAVISNLYRYHNGILRTCESLEAEFAESRQERLGKITDNFRRIVSSITGECGIHLTQDTHAPEQASFVVPGLGISIVPLVYGDHHSWNLAWLAGEERNVPTHRHYHGVEIHLGYDPTHGVTILGDSRADVDEGYAMPIPPETDHGWINTTDDIHHVPFIFGSLKHAGWGVFLDVEASPQPTEELKRVERDSPRFGQMVYLEREIDRAAGVASSWRKTLIPYTVTNRSGSGGLELSLTRIKQSGYTYAADEFRAVSIARGTGIVNIAGIERSVESHDHFGIPAGMICTVKQTGDAPLVALDATIRAHGTRSY